MRAGRFPLGSEGGLSLDDSSLPDPGPGQVRIKVTACGLCHTDTFTQASSFEGFTPIAGHEVVGRIEAFGYEAEATTKGFHLGDRVGVGWFGGCCHQCHLCTRKNIWVGCKKVVGMGLDMDGGYATHMVANIDALVRIPEALKDEEAAPLLCAGVTTFNALRHSNASPGDLVAIVGIGGLGHLAIQFARHFGFKVAAISSSSEKKEVALQLGAHVYIDSSKEKAPEVLMKLGGAALILDTAGDIKLIPALINGLAYDGELFLASIVLDPISFLPSNLRSRRGRIAAWPSGDPRDTQEALDFAVLTGIRSRNEVFPFQSLPEAYTRMASGKARFRIVVTM